MESQQCEVPSRFLIFRTPKLLLPTVQIKDPVNHIKKISYLNKFFSLINKKKGIY